MHIKHFLAYFKSNFDYFLGRKFDVSKMNTVENRLKLPNNIMAKI